MFGNPQKALSTAIRKNQAGDLVSSFRIVNELISNDPFYVEARRHRSQWLMASARYREAIEDMIIVIQMFPRDDEAVALIGDCLFQLGNHSEASGRYLESITLNPKNKRALRGLLALADLP